MARICPLFSGSSGNSTYIGGASGGILIDAGMSFKTIKEALIKSGSDIENIKAIAVTHEHYDHIKGLKVLLKQTKVPVIASEKTLKALETAQLIPESTKEIAADNSELEIGDFIISRFATSHDCEGSSGYSVNFAGGKKITVCTDLGIISDEVRNALNKSDIVLIESNHDIDMLKRGPYPPKLKLRILSDKGHLSNTACAVELPELLNSGTTRFILGHLSRHNNLPMLAFSKAKSALADCGAEIDCDYILKIAKPSDNEVMTI